jgi:hypothetical protein
MSTPEAYFNAMTDPKIGKVPVYEYVPFVTLMIERDQLETLQRSTNASGKSLEAFVLSAAMQKAKGQP